jgi:hypothetical protein
VEWLERRELLSVAQPFHVILPSGGRAAPLSTAGPTGMTPTMIRHAYGFDQIALPGGVAADGSGTTIAIVDAYDDPNIAGDLHQFDLRFGLPDPVFTKLDQNGGSQYPTADGGWASEIALDAEWAHAVAPGARILLVEAADDSYSNLFAAVRFAANQPGVVAVSMSWGGEEFNGETSFDSTFTTPAGHAGVTFVAASGDTGAPASYPAISPNVLAVGGTTLYVTSGGTYISESGWGGSGGGVSALEAQPAYQVGVVSQSSTQRTNPDVAYDANPATGYAVYDSFNNPVSSRWSQFGGTSAASPQWAALIALADQGRALVGESPLDGPSQTLPLLYTLPASAFNDVISGSSAGSPRLSAGPGYDVVTGRGTPVANQVVSDLIGTNSLNQNFVAAAYQDILGRPVDPAGLATWTALLNQGRTPAWVAAQLTHSAEYFANFVTGAYQSFLGRTGSAAEVSGWVSALQAGWTDEQVEAAFTSSPEYLQAHGGEGATWVSSLYHDFLGRTASTSEVNAWVRALAGGASPSLVALAFAGSTERATAQVTADYQKYLGRTPLASEVAGWVNAFLQGTSDEDIVAGLVGSAEYYQDHASG